MIGSKPGAGETILHYPIPINMGDRPQIAHISNIKCDKNGEFVVDRVFPGKGHIARQIEYSGPGGRRLASLSCINEVDAVAGQSTKVALGGVGRPVVGRVTQPGGIPNDWVADGSSLIEKRSPPDRAPRQYHFAVEPDGTFRIDDVEPGEYGLSIEFRQALGEPPNTGDVLAQLRDEFTVPNIPGGRSDEPLDLGELEL
jgi:hypothetical protein